jgi:hypothetical protein
MALRQPTRPQTSYGSDVQSNNNVETVTGIWNLPIQATSAYSTSAGGPGVLYLDPSFQRWSLNQPYGDVFGPYPGLTVAGFYNVPLSAGNPLEGQGYFYSSAAGYFQLSYTSSYGYVVGPSSSTDNAVPLWDGTDGRRLKNSTIIVSTSAVNVATRYVQNVVDPALAQDAATKNYVDTSSGPYSFLYTLSAEKTAGATDNWHQLSTNSITLTAGTWEVTAGAFFGNNTNDPAYNVLSIIISTNNGADTNTIPTAVSTTGAVTLKAGITSINGLSVSNNYSIISGTAAGRMSYTMPPCIIAVSASTANFVVTYATMTTASRSRIFANILARRISSATS